MPSGSSLWVPAYVGVGSNLGDPVARVRAAFDALAGLPDTRLIATSRLYRTAPFGPVAQGDFINAVAGLLTQLDAVTLLHHIRAIEKEAGRVREQRWGPRTLDLDLLVFGDQRIDTPELTVPHPGIAERVFVLAPLMDIAPTLDVPGVGRVEELRRGLGDGGIVEILAA
ncbi:MAG: 2-amino-4-hydroxy-6-hydroxymethyldihydropteridine diphosphokinase [Pseudomonadota bacterium]|jgi:2-amino-4-hydroxy-6-hydroxymethyldihydropteridine diphosphokinase|nr:MAG: 2-amino-4-hydroxy-6-hydroxymethyldihydropteridine diphosphokinase [Pseudomonadota bacterium]